MARPVAWRSGRGETQRRPQSGSRVRHLVATGRRKTAGFGRHHGQHRPDHFWQDCLTAQAGDGGANSWRRRGSLSSGRRTARTASRAETRQPRADSLVRRQGGRWSLFAGGHASPVLQSVGPDDYTDLRRGTGLPSQEQQSESLNNKSQSELTSCPVEQKMAAKLREGASAYLCWVRRLAHLIEELRFVFIRLGRMRYFWITPQDFCPI